jgi:hypothetical protein
MAVGTLGSVVFEASSDLVRTFRDASHKTSARWQQHEVIGQKQKQEFGGPNLRTLSLAIRLDVNLGVDPEEEAKALRESVETGEVLAFMLGGEPRGDWIVKELDEAWRNVGADGQIGIIDLSLSLEEYV